MNPSSIGNFDPDVLQAKADLLRARNIVPPLGKPPGGGGGSAEKLEAEPMKAFEEKPAEPLPVAELVEPVEPQADVDEELPVGGFETDPEIERRILAKLEAQEQPDVDDQVSSDIADGGTKSWIDMIKDQAASQPQDREVPKYDLAEQIMAQQRKVSSEKRKGPGQKLPIKAIDPIPQPQNLPQEPAQPVTTRIVEIPRKKQAASTKYDSILAKIVSRDIERLIKAG